MRKELLEIIKCPACGNFGANNFQLIENAAVPFEIKEAQIKCSCGETFNVKNGILDLLYNPDKEVLEEIKGILDALKEGNSKHTDEMLLSLPESAESKNPFDATCKYSLNFYKVINELGVSGGELVLDLGSGNTWSSNKLAEMGCRCVALDISVPKFKGLESAETYFKSGKVYYERIVSDMKKLPFADCTFDIVMSNSSIHHASNLKASFKEINRVLKEKGKIALINEAVCGIFSVTRDKSRSNLPEFVKRLKWTENTYSIPQYLRYLRASGFTKSRIFFPPSVDARLSEMKKAAASCKNKTIKYRFAFLLSFFWGKYSGNVLKKIVFWPAALIFGVPLLLFAEKKTK